MLYDNLGGVGWDGRWEGDSREGTNVYIPMADLCCPGSTDGKESACNVGDVGSIPGLGRPPWRRAWQPTPVFLSGESQGQRSLVGYSPWGHKESDAAEQLSTAQHSTVSSKAFCSIPFLVSHSGLLNCTSDLHVMIL